MPGVMSRLRPYLLSIALHAALIVLIIVMGMRNWSATPTAPTALAIEAVAVDAAELERLSRRAPTPKEEPEPIVEPAPEPKPEVKPEPPKPEPPKPAPVNKQEERRKAELAKREQENRVKAEATRKAETLRLEEQRRREAESRRMKDELEAEERRRVEDERVRTEREAALQRELSEEVAASAAAEARRAAAARAASLSAQWASAIQARVQRAWIRPSSAQAGLDCRVAVTQAAGGTVIRAEVKECNGDEAVRQSLEAAVFRASPLPPPPDPSLFERNIELRFRPND